MRSHPIRVNPICPKQSAPYNSVKPFPWSNLPIVNGLFLPRDIWMDSTMKNKKNWRQNIFSILFVENVVFFFILDIDKIQATSTFLKQYKSYEFKSLFQKLAFQVIFTILKYYFT